MLHGPTRTRRLIVHLALVCIAAAGCKTGSGINTYDYTSTVTGVTGAAMATPEKIEEGNTYEIYFQMHKPEKCVKVSVGTSIIYPSIKANQYAAVSSFFIVEKRLDITRFNIAQKVATPEIGRNFDLAWNAQDDATLCTRPDDPILRLGEGLYRIRFTAFRKEDLLYTVNIYTNKSKVSFK